MNALQTIYYVPRQGTKDLYRYVRPVGSDCHVLQDVESRQCYCWTLEEIAERFEVYRLKKVRA